MLIFPVSMSSKFWVPATSVLVEESETIFNGIRRDYYGNYLQWDQERLSWQSSGLYIAIIVKVTSVKTTQLPITYLYDSVRQWLKKAFYFFIKKFWWKMNVRHPMGVLYSFSIKNILWSNGDKASLCLLMIFSLNTINPTVPTVHINVLFWIRVRFKYPARVTKTNERP